MKTKCCNANTHKCNFQDYVDCCDRCDKPCHTPVQKEHKCSGTNCRCFPQTSSGERTNFMQMGEFHCWKCHKSSDRYETHECRALASEIKPCTEKCGKWFKPLPSPSSESWVDQYPLNTFHGETKRELVSFIKNTIIPAEVERGRKTLVDRIDNICEEFGDNPAQCLSIIGEALHGGKDDSHDY